MARALGPPLFHLRGSSTLGSPISSSNSLAPAIGDLLVSTNMHGNLMLTSLLSKPLECFNKYFQMPCQVHLGETRVKARKLARVTEIESHRASSSFTNGYCLRAGLKQGAPDEQAAK